MNNYERALVAANDQRSGRVIPKWRFFLLLLFITVALLAAYRIGEYEVNGAWLVGVAFFLGCGIEWLFGRFRMRSIS